MGAAALLPLYTD